MQKKNTLMFRKDRLTDLQIVSLPDRSVIWTNVSLKEAKMWATPKTSSPSRTCGPSWTWTSSLASFFPFLGAILWSEKEKEITRFTSWTNALFRSRLHWEACSECRQLQETFCSSRGTPGNRWWAQSRGARGAPAWESPAGSRMTREQPEEGRRGGPTARLLAANNPNQPAKKKLQITIHTNCKKLVLIKILMFIIISLTVYWKVTKIQNSKSLIKKTRSWK